VSSEPGTYSAEQVRSLMLEGAQLVDVRAEHEWEAGRIAGARHLELGGLSSRAAEIDRDRAVVFYCRGDNRSEMAAAAFAAEGYDVATLDGGIGAWVDAGLPLDPEDGYVAESGAAASILQARKKAAQG
jgi:rhodanese-related sulfurtransferase